MKNKEFLNKKAAEIHTAIMQARPDTLESLTYVVGRLWPDFRVKPLYYWGNFQGFKVTIYGKNGGSKQVNPNRTAYAAQSPEIAQY